MASTTIRIDVETHSRLVELSRASGKTLLETVRDAAEALRRQQFAREVTTQLAGLRDDPEQWKNYLAETESTSVRDGLD